MSYVYVSLDGSSAGVRQRLRWAMNLILFVSSQPCIYIYIEREKQIIIIIIISIICESQGNANNGINEAGLYNEYMFVHCSLGEPPSELCCLSTGCCHLRLLPLKRDLCTKFAWIKIFAINPIRGCVCDKVNFAVMRRKCMLILC